MTPPNLAVDCTYSEHVVRARGKKSRFTSISRTPERIRDFGPALYRVLREVLMRDGHGLVGNRELTDHLAKVAKNGEKAERARAIQALRYSRRRDEGLIDWRFSTEGVERKGLITWAFDAIQKYFDRA
ncbi:MAG: hypothetical protein ACLFOY_04750 [Desulfatibacillaceae bacterium]